MANNYDFQITQNGIEYIVNLSLENNHIIVNCYERQPGNTNEFYAHFSHEQLKKYSPSFHSTNSIKEDFIIFKKAIDDRKVRINKSQNNEINLTFILDQDEEKSQYIDLPLEVNDDFNNAEIEYLPPRRLPTISVKANTIKVRRPTVYIDADNNEISKSQFFNNNDIIINNNIGPISSPKKNVIVKKIFSNSDLNNPINHSFSQRISKKNNVYSPQKEFINPPFANQIIHKTTIVPSSPRNQFSSPPKVQKERKYYNSPTMSPPREKIIYTNNGSPSKNLMDYSSYIRNKKSKIIVNSPVVSPNLSTSQSSDFDERINQLSSQISIIQNELQKEKLKLGDILKINENLKKENEKLKEENQILRQNQNASNEYNLLNQKLLEYKNKISKEFEEYKNIKEKEIQQYIDQINKLESENNKYQSEIEKLSKLCSNKISKNMRIIKGEIIQDNNELEFLTNRICQEHKKITLNLLYKARVDSDSAQIFHERCDKAPSSLVLVKTTKNKRFGGFTKMSWAGNAVDKKDNDAFIFSLDKMKIYNIIPDEDAIGCYPAYGPIFLGCQIRIYDKAFEKGGTTFEKELNYQTEEDYELTDGEQQFGVQEIEVYEVILGD